VHNTSPAAFETLAPSLSSGYVLHYFANTNHNLSLLSTPNCQAYFKNSPRFVVCRAFLDLDCLPSDCFHCLYCSLRYFFCCGTALTAYCIHCVTDPPPKRSAPACRSVQASANDKIVENEEVAPRVTPVAAARRSRPYPRAHPLLRIGDPSPYAPSPALPSVDPTVRRSYPLSFYKPKHSPEALVAIGTSLAGAQTTPPETSLSSPKRKKLQKPPISSTFTNIPSA
jgi:hypothetical protein